LRQLLAGFIGDPSIQTAAPDGAGPASAEKRCRYSSIFRWGGHST
jgi:hypothetical protein